MIEMERVEADAVWRSVDAIGVEHLKNEMLLKLARSAAKGRQGWDDKATTQEHLSALLREHVEKGDPVDVANFCMMLFVRGEKILKAADDPRDTPSLVRNHGAAE